MSTLFKKEPTPVADAVQTLHNGVDELSDAVPSALSRAAAEADALARRGLEQARRATEVVRDKATQVGDSTVGYIQNEPVKAVLIAAAVGAVAAAVIGWAARPRDTRN